MKTAYLVDIGVIVDIDEDDGRFAQVYDHRRGYYDKDVYALADRDEAIKQARDHCEDSNDTAYGIVSAIEIEDFDEPEKLGADDIEDKHDFAASKVISAWMREDGKVIPLNIIKDQRS